MNFCFSTEGINRGANVFSPKFLIGYWSPILCSHLFIRNLELNFSMFLVNLVKWLRVNNFPKCVYLECMLSAIVRLISNRRKIKGKYSTVPKNVKILLRPVLIESISKI